MDVGKHRAKSLEISCSAACVQPMPESCGYKGFGNRMMGEFHKLCRSREHQLGRSLQPSPFLGGHRGLQLFQIHQVRFIGERVAGNQPHFSLQIQGLAVAHDRQHIEASGT